MDSAKLIATAKELQAGFPKVVLACTREGDPDSYLAESNESTAPFRRLHATELSHVARAVMLVSDLVTALENLQGELEAQGAALREEVEFRCGVETSARRSYDKMETSDRLVRSQATEIDELKALIPEDTTWKSWGSDPPTDTARWVVLAPMYESPFPGLEPREVRIVYYSRDDGDWRMHCEHARPIVSDALWMYVVPWPKEPQ